MGSQRSMPLVLKKLSWIEEPLCPAEFNHMAIAEMRSLGSSDYLSLLPPTGRLDHFSCILKCLEADNGLGYRLGGKAS